MGPTCRIKGWVPLKMRRVWGVLVRPRATMADVVRHPTFMTTWVVLLLVFLLCGWAFLSTPVGKQALVDERVRVVEALGGRVDDAAYTAMQASPPWMIYLTSGGRLLLTPEITLLVAAGLVALTATGKARISYVAALAIAVHASVVLAVQQIVATPIHFVRESLTSPTTLAGVLPMLDEGTPASRLFGSIDMFGLWWIWLLAVGVAAATNRPVRSYWWRLMAAYIVIAAGVATVFAVLGSEGG